MEHKNLLKLQKKKKTYLSSKKKKNIRTYFGLKLDDGEITFGWDNDAYGVFPIEAN